MLDQDQRALVLGTSLFSSIGTQTAYRILEASHKHCYARGETIFREDDPASAIWVVLEGWVKLSRYAKNGAEVIVAVLPAGEVIGEPVALNKGVYPVACTASADAKLVALDAEFIRQEIRADPDLALGILSSTFRHLKRLVAQTEGLLAKSGRQRVAAYLVEIAPVSSGACKIELPFEKELIAGKLGLQPQSLSRILKQLKDEGVVTAGHIIDVKDVAALRHYASDK